MRRQVYRSKSQLALETLQRTLERGHPMAGWVAGDDAVLMMPTAAFPVPSSFRWFGDFVACFNAKAPYVLQPVAI